MNISLRIRTAARTAGFVLALTVTCGLTACAWVPRRAAGFDDVAKLAEERTGFQINWDRESPEGDKIRDLLHSKLTDPLTAESAAQIALLNNRKLQATYQSLGIAQADVIQASLLPNPIFDGNMKNSINGGSDPEIEFTVAENFVEVLTIPLKRRIAKAEFEAAKLRVAQEILALASETRGQFIAAQADEQMIELLQQVVLALDASADAARRLHEAGNIRDSDLDIEEAALAQAKLDLASAQISARKSRERLNILMGFWGPQAGIKITARLPEIPAEEIKGEDIEKRVVEKNLDLAILRQRLLALGDALGLKRATALFPDISIVGAFKRETDGNRLLGPGLSLPIPLFDQGRARVAAAKAQLSRAQDEFYFKAVETRAAARAAWDHLQLARARAVYSRDVVLPLQNRILAETQLEYNAMQVGVFHLLQAKRTSIETGKRYVEDLRDYWLAKAEVESLLSGHVTAV
ncbi:TolC family protein, partial [Candidatus Sumerlaeota bacterium]|nr:TolC family protein [Candidatus Sumerlaeota bacterium]